MEDRSLSIRIITIHGIPNFGSALQCMALCRYLRKSGYDNVEVIDYNPIYFKPHSLKSVAGMILNIKDSQIRGKKYREFVKTNIPLTEQRFRSYKDLAQAGLVADVYIAGGDQLWNVFHNCGRDDSYKLTFVHGKKISYGTSMGQYGFSDVELDDLADKIKGFSAISVRESMSVHMLATRRLHAQHVADPVFLLDPDEYDKVLVRPVAERFLLVYMVTPSKLLEDCIAYLSKRHNLEVILCFGLSKKCTCDKHDKRAGPAEILGYVKYADFVLSSSFHATAFATMFKKQFFTILPHEKTNDRILDFLELRELKNRIITEGSDLYGMLNDCIDYSRIKDYKDMIDSSKAFLKNALHT